NLAKSYFVASGRMRIRAGSMTVKCPAKSVLSTIRAARVVPTSLRAALATGAIQCQKTPAGRHAKQAHQNPYRRSARSVLLARPMPVRLRLSFPARRYEPKRCHARLLSTETRHRRENFRLRESASQAALGYTFSDLSTSRA